MAANTKNKFPADKAGTRYGEFRNTKRYSQSKVKTGNDSAKGTPADQANRQAG